MKSLFLVIALLLTSFLLHAKNIFYTKDTTTEKTTLTLQAGKTVLLTLDEDIDASTVMVTNNIDFIARSDLKLNGMILIRQNAIAEGVVIRMDNDLEGRVTAVTISLHWVQAVDTKAIAISGKKEIIRFVYDENGKGIIKKGSQNFSASVIEEEEIEVDAPVKSKIEPIVKPIKKEEVKEVPVEKIPTDTLQKKVISRFTPIRLSTTKYYQSGDLAIGKTVALRSLEALKSEESGALIKFSASAQAEVTEIIEGAFGKEITLRVSSVQATNGQNIPLQGDYIFEEKDFLTLQEISAKVAQDVVLNH